MKKIIEKPQKQTNIINQEIKFARLLADNSKKTRDNALKGLRKWLRLQSKLELIDDEFMRLWKGLFYSMWMSDKPLIQEECAENIANLIHFLPSNELGLEFFKCGLFILGNEWFGIDQWRLDKFLMFVRRLLRQAFILLSRNNWNDDLIRKFILLLEQSILDQSKYKPLGLLMHFIEIYLEELAKITKNNILINEFIQPFIKLLAQSTDQRLQYHIKKFIFIYLIEQSDIGLDYQDKYEAWKRAGFPGSINSIKKIQLSDDDDDNDDNNDNNNDNNDNNTILDPRAGHVDVILPQLKFNSKLLANQLLEYRFKTGTTTKSRKILVDLAKKFNQLDCGNYPLGITKLNHSKSYNINIQEAAKRLIKFDNKLLGKNRKRKITKNHNNNNNKPKKIQKILNQNESIESIFRRNSGTWFVTNKLIPIKNDDKIVNCDDNKEICNNDNNIEIDEWDKPLKDGEYEIFIPLKKKLKLKIMKKSTLNSNHLIMRKKVKINTKLNQTQDVQDHKTQILTSPAIPYDANKKPLRPLLKKTFLKGPIDPFYNNNNI